MDTPPATPPTDWLELDAPPELERELYAPEGARWWMHRIHRLYAGVYGDGTPPTPAGGGSPLVVVFVTEPAGHADDGAPIYWYPPLDLVGPALEALLPDGVVYQHAFPPCIVGSPGDFDRNAATAGGVLQLVQVGVIRGSTAAARWELGGGGFVGEFRDLNLHRGGSA